MFETVFFIFFQRSGIREVTRTRSCWRGELCGFGITISERDNWRSLIRTGMTRSYSTRPGNGPSPFTRWRQWNTIFVESTRPLSAERRWTLAFEFYNMGIAPFSKILKCHCYQILYITHHVEPLKRLTKNLKSPTLGHTIATTLATLPRVTLN